MKHFLMKYNANKLETSKDEGLLTLEKARERILKLLTENMKNFKDNSWDISNRMNKLMTDTEKNSIFTLRLGGKRIVRYSLDLLNTEQKLQFLADFYTSVAEREFDEDITDFLAKEIDNANARKKEANERRRNKKKAEREKKAEEAKIRTLAATEPILSAMGLPIPIKSNGKFSSATIFVNLSKKSTKSTRRISQRDISRSDKSAPLPLLSASLTFSFTIPEFSHAPYPPIFILSPKHSLKWREVTR